MNSKCAISVTIRCICIQELPIPETTHFHFSLSSFQVGQHFYLFFIHFFPVQPSFIFVRIQSVDDSRSHIRMCLFKQTLSVLSELNQTRYEKLENNLHVCWREQTFETKMKCKILILKKDGFQYNLIFFLGYYFNELKTRNRLNNSSFLY